MKINEIMKELLKKIMFVCIGLCVACYLIVILLMVVGLSIKMNGKELATFSMISALFSVIMLVFFRSQAKIDCSNLEENKPIIKEYTELTNKTIVKEKQFKSIEKFMVMQTIKDVISKGFTLFAGMYCLMYIVMEGSKDWGLFVSGLGTVFLSLALGLSDYSKTYTYYNENHIPFLIEKTRRLKEDEKIKREKDAVLSKLQSNEL